MTRSAYRHVSILLLLTALLLLAMAVPVFAASSHDGHKMDGHHEQASDMKMPAAEEHAGHEGMHGDKEHVHREMPADDPGVGLDEKIGASIPLDLEFLDESGRTVNLRQLVDGPTIIAPIYYRCPNVCNFLQSDLARVLPDLRREPGVDYRVLSISFDDTETPELAASSKEMYFKSMRKEYPQDAWRFLTGERDAILELTGAAGYRFKKMHDGEFLHPVAIFVVDSNGTIIRYLHGTHYLPKDVTLALVEASEGRLGTTIQKVVRFCFSYDPENKTYVFNLLRVSGTVVLLTLLAFLAFLFLGGRKKTGNTE